MNLLHLIVKPAYAVVCNPLLKDCTQTQAPVAYTANVIAAITTIFFIVAVVYFLWYFVMSAYHMISSNGDPKKVETARDGLLNAFIGLVVIFSVFAILKFVGTVLGIQGLDLLHLSLPSL
jgi:hypothetical protein